MSIKQFCEQCQFEAVCEVKCNAFYALQKICAEQDIEEKRTIIREYAKEIEVIEYEVSDELRELGEKVIAGRPELFYIAECEIKIGYVLSYESKKKDGKTIAADCRKVTGPYKGYLPFDFVITFYEPNMSYMTDNQRKVLMLHELKHIGVGDRGLKIEPHNIEDFIDILGKFGLNWNDYGNDVEDILGGGDNGKKQAKGKGKHSNQR